MFKSFLSRADARWAVVGIFALSNTLNFLDRQILTSLAPQLKSEFGITNAGFGDVLMVFSICYGLAAPLAGYFLDRFGLTIGSTVAVALWSIAGMATGWTSSLAGLIACRAALGVGEGGGIPATGKASATYLAPKERAFGSAISQVGLTIGGILAPLLAQWISARYGWRWAFFVTGALGFVWIPLWIAVARNAPRGGVSHGPQGSEIRPMLTDSRFYAVLLSNVLLMSVYSLWVNWTTVFLVSEYGMTQADANYQLAWIPPLFATAGGFFGGWLTLRWTRGSSDVTPARMRVILIGSAMLLGRGRGAAHAKRRLRDCARLPQLLRLRDVECEHLLPAAGSVRRGARRRCRRRAHFGLRIASGSLLERGRAYRRLARFRARLHRRRTGPDGLLGRAASGPQEARRMMQRLKKGLFAALGLDPEAVVVVVRSGDPARAEQMAGTMRELVPGCRIVDVPFEQGSSIDLALSLARRLRGLRVALMATLFDGTEKGAAQRRAALLVAPTKILAFNARLERQHLRLSQCIASWLFLRGVPRDRIFLRPSWLAPWKKDRSELPRQWRDRGGRGFRQGAPKVAVVSPYLPWPRSHGGAVRLEGLLYHASRDTDIVFFGFEDGQTPADYARIAGCCARLYSAAKPRYREPRWSSLAPPEACEFWNRDLDRALRLELASCGCTLLQGEYTQMAGYRPDVLVEHDITTDLMAQVLGRRPSLSAWWDWWRWRRFERAALRNARSVVVMSEKDRDLAGLPAAVVIPNGVDLDRFTPARSAPRNGFCSLAASATSPMCAPGASSSNRSGLSWPASTI